MIPQQQRVGKGGEDVASEQDNLSALMEAGVSLDEIGKHLKDGLSLEEQLAAVKAMQERGEWKTQTGEEWLVPIPFDTPYIPDFPVECLPSPLSSFVECLAESTQTPEEMAGALSLGVLALAFQGKYAVEITPDWKEPLCLWPVAIAEPGERKSAVFAALLSPVYEYENEVRASEAEEVAQSQSERKLLESRLSAAMRPRKKVSLAEQQEEVRDLTAQLAAFEDKHPFRLLVDDTTTEKLADLMEQQGGCITVASAEGGVFDAMTGRYDKNANFDVYLKGHAGDHLSVDRMGRKGNYIADPRLSMLLTVQPFVLAGLMNNSTLKGKGMCGRFLYAVCRSKVGRRSIDPAPIPAKVKEEYEAFIRYILADHGKGIIRLSKDAALAFRSFQVEIEKSLGNEWTNMRDWGGKLAGATVRIAALFHAATITGAATETPISADTMMAAIAIAGVLSQHAEAAYQVMGADENTENAKYILARLSKCSDGYITRTDLTRLCCGKFDKTEDMTPALDILENRGYIRADEAEIGYNGRKKTIYKINPTLRVK